jgi:hypothetical protein
VTGSGSSRVAVAAKQQHGTSTDGTANFGTGDGIHIVDGTGNFIGGHGADTSTLTNRTFNSGRDGVRIEAAVVGSNPIQSHLAWNNGGLGINLVGGVGEDAFGVTPNDQAAAPYDTDAGPNGYQNTPVITNASFDGRFLTIGGTLRTTADQAHIVTAYFSRPRTRRGRRSAFHTWFANATRQALTGVYHGRYRSIPIWHFCPD